MLFPVACFLMLVGSVAADAKGDEGIADAQHHNPILYLGAIAAILATLAACITGH